jgi:molybdopterin/thiamine biosynthesis adenylyltransferase/rhodanese-related sulfurtransferase
MSKQVSSYERYQRQILLPGFGTEGQQKLEEASVLIVGAGGLGCPALQYLTAAGVGTLGIIDDDLVSLNNLHRQILYKTEDIGLSKADVATRHLQAMNPGVHFNSYPFRLTTKNTLAVLNGYDLVLDATDNFATRYIINDACVLLKKPFVYGAITQFEGQVAVFNASKEATNYRDLFPQPPSPGSILNCAEAGVLGVLPGIIGTMQATEVIKLIAGIGKPLVNQLFTYNALTNESFVFDMAPRSGTASLLPQTPAEFEATDYDWLCNTPAAVNEIDTDAFNEFLQRKNTVIIDVREAGEMPDAPFPHRKIPLSVLSENTAAIDADAVVLFCQSGKRSREAATVLSATFGTSKEIYSLQGGILNWIANGKQEA